MCASAGEDVVDGGLAEARGYETAVCVTDGFCGQRSCRRYRVFCVAASLAALSEEPRGEVAAKLFATRRLWRRSAEEGMLHVGTQHRLEHAAACSDAAIAIVASIEKCLHQRV